MRKPSFHLGDVITGEPHLSIAQPAPLPAGVPAEPAKASALSGASLFTRSIAAVRRAFRLGPTPERALASALDRAFMR